MQQERALRALWTGRRDRGYTGSGSASTTTLSNSFLSLQTPEYLVTQKLARLSGSGAWCQHSSYTSSRSPRTHRSSAARRQPRPTSSHPAMASTRWSPSHALPSAPTQHDIEEEEEEQPLSKRLEKSSTMRAGWMQVLRGAPQTTPRGEFWAFILILTHTRGPLLYYLGLVSGFHANRHLSPSGPLKKLWTPHWLARYQQRFIGGSPPRGQPRRGSRRGRTTRSTLGGFRQQCGRHLGAHVVRFNGMRRGTGAVQHKS